MNNSINSYPLLDKSIDQDDLTSNTSTTSRRMLVRKPEQNFQRRSSSKKYQQRSESSLQISKFYVKLISNPQFDKKSKIQIKNNPVLNKGKNNSPLNDKKRTPTPAPRNKKQMTTPEKKRKQSNIQSDLYISDLQCKLTQEKDKSNMLQKRVIEFQKQLKRKTLKNKQLNDISEKHKRQISQMQNKINEYIQKIHQYQSFLGLNISPTKQSENKSKLERLKNMIKQSRYEEIQNQLTFMKNQNIFLKQKLNDVNIQKQKIITQVKTLQIQNTILSQKISHSKLTKIQRQSIDDIYVLYAIKSQQNQHLVKEINKLQLKLNYQNRIKYQDMQKLKNKKNQEISNLRKKIAQLFLQIKQIKKKNQNSYINKSFKNKLNQRISRYQSSNQQQNISFSLSP